MPEPPEATPIPGTPTYIRRTGYIEHRVWSNNHTVQVPITVPYSGGAIIIPLWTSNSNWVAISAMTRNISTNQPSNTVTAGAVIDAWSGSGGESHGGGQMAWILNPTTGAHLITVNVSYWDNFEVLGAGALFYANCSEITASGAADGGPNNSRSFNVTSATGRTTLGMFINDAPAAATRNGTLRWTGTSGDQAGWVDYMNIQELPGAATVTHSQSGGGGAWGRGLDLRAA